MGSPCPPPSNVVSETFHIKQIPYHWCYISTKVFKKYIRKVIIFLFELFELLFIVGKKIEIVKTISLYNHGHYFYTTLIFRVQDTIEQYVLFGFSKDLIWLNKVVTVIWAFLRVVEKQMILTLLNLVSTRAHENTLVTGTGSVCGR